LGGRQGTGRRAAAAVGIPLQILARPWTQPGIRGYTQARDTKVTNRSAEGRIWVQGWRRAGERLRQLRKAELQEISTEEALLRLAGAFDSCRLHATPRPTSGLVEQQRWFGRLRR